ncbi:MAG TPA: GDSL-type esterase/lipase family protein [Solirubrobacteraceae bacterium]|nr:GDSL-type esterase/lipase family protein [Solirubrobacteraceae bacterium]
MPRDLHNPFILDRETGRTMRARDALICIFVAVILLLVIEGASIRNSGKKMESGIQRTVVLAVGHPAGWLADQLPLAAAADKLTAALSPDEELTGGPGGFNDPPGSTGGAQAAGPRGGDTEAAPITSDYFDPYELGVKPVPLPALKSLLVTGDSLAQPLDVQVARSLADEGVATTRDVHLGTGISKSDLVDWGLLSDKQVEDEEPDAVIMFMGANEGFPFPVAGGGRERCCSAEWAATYAARARSMMDTYRRDGDARVYWLTLPMPREPARQEIARAVNAAIAVAAQPYRSHVRVLDMSELFTPGGRYRAAMPIGGRETLVREPDGIHLNEAGARLALDVVLERLRADFKSLG